VFSLRKNDKICIELETDGNDLTQPREVARLVPYTLRVCLIITTCTTFY